MNRTDRWQLVLFSAMFLAAVAGSVALAQGGGSEATCTACPANQCLAVPLVGGPCDPAVDDCCCCTQPVPPGGFSCTCQTKTHCSTTSGCYYGGEQ